MEKTVKFGDSNLILKGLKKEIEAIEHQLQYLTGIKSYKTEKRGVIGGDVRETTFYVMFGQNALRNEEEFIQKRNEFLKRYAGKFVLFSDLENIKKEVKAIFDAHVSYDDQTRTPEQETERIIESNKIHADYEAKRAEERSKTELEKDALKKQYPHLLLVQNNGLSSRIMATKNIRIELDKAFSGLKFSIRSESYSGGDSINVDWTDGPTSDEVKKIISKYQEGHFDGMNDIYEYSDRAFCSLFGGTKYVFGNRSLTPDRFIEVAEKLGYKEFISVRLGIGSRLNEKIWEVTGIEDNEKTMRVRDEIIRETYQTSFYTKPEISTETVSNFPESSSGDIQVKENKEKEGVEISFAAKPDQQIIIRLKQNGFRWNHKTKVWYKKLTANSLSFANSLIKKNEETNSNEDEAGLMTESYSEFERNLQSESRGEIR